MADAADRRRLLDDPLGELVPPAVPPTCSARAQALGARLNGFLLADRAQALRAILTRAPRTP